MPRSIAQGFEDFEPILRATNAGEVHGFSVGSWPVCKFGILRNLKQELITPKLGTQKWQQGKETYQFQKFCLA